MEGLLPQIDSMLNLLTIILTLPILVMASFIFHALVAFSDFWVNFANSLDFLIA